ncbi:uncharacterized protein LOC103967690 [Pyrus x bretschneideri]|uniref:uncharacterized protein LOC103967690 n=1 Tax=Pyrus x bretschneideri TaxID=225117 RepID=UPI002030926E|nr:uncharacterized protein LOC103967690 [Pyrus x bretschneideri]
MARPMPLESNLSQWMCLDSGSGVMGVFDSDQKGFQRPRNGFVSSMDVGLIMASDLETAFEVKLVNNLGLAKKEEWKLRFAASRSRLFFQNAELQYPINEFFQFTKTAPSFLLSPSPDPTLCTLSFSITKNPLPSRRCTSSSSSFSFLSVTLNATPPSPSSESAETECEIDVDDEIHACPYKRSIVNNHRRSEYDLTGSQRQRKQNRIQTQIKIRDLNGSPRAETRKGTSSSTMQLSSLHWEWVPTTSIPTLITIAESLKSNGVAVEKSISTSTVVLVFGTAIPTPSYAYYFSCCLWRRSSYYQGSRLYQKNISRLL